MVKGPDDNSHKQIDALMGGTPALIGQLIIIVTILAAIFLLAGNH